MAGYIGEKLRFISADYFYLCKILFITIDKLDYSRSGGASATLPYHRLFYAVRHLHFAPYKHQRGLNRLAILILSDT